MNLSELHKVVLEGGWSLFLDRDGVINVRKMDGYILNPSEFEFIEGVPAALSRIVPLFDHTVVVTNQRGVARKLMTEEDLSRVHGKMKSELESVGAVLDGIFHCPHDRSSGCRCRKPGPGLIEQALDAFPSILPSKSLLIGDTTSDMELGRSFGMITLHVGAEEVEDHLYDYHLESLADLWS